MTDDLNALQTRLEGYFATLASARKDNSLPIFAFEHGLDIAYPSAEGRLVEWLNDRS